MTSFYGQFIAKLKLVLAIALSFDTHTPDCFVKSSYSCERLYLELVPKQTEGLKMEMCTLEGANKNEK